MLIHFIFEMDQAQGTIKLITNKKIVPWNNRYSELGRLLNVERKRQQVDQEFVGNEQI